MEISGDNVHIENAQVAETQSGGVLANLGSNCVELQKNVVTWFNHRSQVELDNCLSQISADMEKIIEANPNLSMERIRNRQKAKRITNGGFTKGIILVSDEDGQEHPDLPKLVRDKVTDVLKVKNIPFSIRTITYQELPWHLAKKIKEEFVEFSEATDDIEMVEELADMMEARDQLQIEEKKSPIGYGKSSGFAGFVNFWQRAGRRYKSG